MPAKPPPAPSTLGQNVKRLRLERGMSQTKLAKKAGMKSGKVHVCRLEMGRYQTASLPTLAGLARGLRCSMESLLKEQPATVDKEMEELLS